MTKRMKRIAALLTCGLVLASGTSVYAGNAEGTLLGVSDFTRSIS